LAQRGISEETAAAYWLGYDPAADPASAPGAIGEEYKAHPAPRLILPTGPGHYVARRIDGISEFAKLNPAGSKPGLFNTRILNSQETPAAIFVTEGIFDALAIIEAGAPAIALNSANNAEALIKR
jgi:DNA primase